jgi:hypothetical protein
MSRARATTFSGNQTKKNKGLPNAFLNNLAETSNTKIDENFYKRVIELENEIQLSQNPSTTSIEELIKLYEKGIESFTESHSQQKVNYFKNKLTKLIIGYNKIKKKQEDNKKPTSWSKFMNAHKKNKNKFMLFLNVETSKKEATNILDNREKVISAGYDQITQDLEEQNKKFLERRKAKRKLNMEKKGNESKSEILDNDDEESGEKKIYTSISNKLRGRNDKVDSSLNDFMKKLHYIYVHSKIFETPIEALNEILEQIFLHKINKYYYYQDQIKQFELVQQDAEKEGEEHDEGIEFLIKDLQNERKSYYMSLESLIDQIRNRIKERCSETSNDDKNVKKYLDELMNNISKIFIK